MADITKNAITMRRWDDLHVHFRSDSMAEAVLPLTARYCGRGIAMPNTKPAILTADAVEQYRAELISCVPEGFSFEPLMTIEIRDTTTPQIVMDAHRAGAVAGKIYPKGVTTNSEHGLEHMFHKNMLSVYEMMSELGMLLLIHGEADLDRVLVTERERKFLPRLTQLVRKFPDLKIVLEHVTTKQAVKKVRELGPNVAATITAHHLYLTLNDVIGSGIYPHHMCMPVPKGFDDLDALLGAAMSGDPSFFFGSDSAPHSRENKECAEGACGVFTAGYCPALLAQIFDRYGCLEMLEPYTSEFGARFYGLRPNKGTITLRRQPVVVEEEYAGVVPFMAGKTLDWSLDEAA